MFSWAEISYRSFGHQISGRKFRTANFAPSCLIFPYISDKSHSKKAPTRKQNGSIKVERWKRHNKNYEIEKMQIGINYLKENCNCNFLLKIFNFHFFLYFFPTRPWFFLISGIVSAKCPEESDRGDRCRSAQVLCGKRKRSEFYN